MCKTAYIIFLRWEVLGRMSSMFFATLVLTLMVNLSLWNRSKSCENGLKNRETGNIGRVYLLKEKRWNYNYKAYWMLKEEK